MKRNSIIKTIGVTAMAFAGLGLFSCSSDDVKAPAQEADGRLTLQLSLEMPIETRSSTNADGSSSSSTDEGLENENKISKVDIYFAKVTDQNEDPSKDEIFFPLTGITDITLDNGKITIKKSVPAKAFAVIMADMKTRLYVVANSTESIEGKPTEAELSFSAPIEFVTNGVEMPMTNKAASGILDFTGKTAEDIMALLPDTENGIVDLSKEKKSDATDLSKLGSYGTISLERTYARLDYKTVKEKNIYPLGTSGVYVKVVEMIPLNVAKSQYLFRHTATGTNTAATGTVTLFGTENGGVSGSYTWIADIDSKTFSNPAASETLTGKSLSAFAQGVDTPWCYISENVPQSTKNMIQSLSTGIRFKVLLCDNDGTALSKEDLTSNSYFKVEANGDNLTITDTKLGYKDNGTPTPMSTTAINESDRYYLNYYYWIRHNDNNDLTVQAPMEFAVVRNNIYKLSITGFNYLPHDYDSDGPDEYPNPDPLAQDFVVKVKVLPWDWYKITDEI